MDTLQCDIDVLEREKTELRERVKELSRKTLMEGIVRQSSVGQIITSFIVTIIIIFYTPGSKDPRGYKLKMLKSKCWIVTGPAGQLAECCAKALLLL